MNAKNIGVAFALVTALMWALETVLVKLAYAQSAGFLQTVFFRSVIVSLIATGYILASKNARFQMTRRETSALFYIAFVASIIADALFFYALAMTSIVNASLIAHLQPVFIVLFGFFVLKQEKIMAPDYLGIFFMLVAAFFVSSKSIENIMAFRFGSFGDFLIIICAVLWATTSIVVKKYLSEIHSGVIIFFRFVISSTVFFAVLFFTGSLVFPSAFQVIAGIAVGIGFVFYYESLKRIKAAQVSALELASPFFAAFLGIVFLNESMTWLSLFGMAILLIGIYFLSKKE